MPGSEQDSDGAVGVVEEDVDVETREVTANDISEHSEEDERSPIESEDGIGVRRAEFEPLEHSQGETEGDNIGLLLEVSVPVTVELGSTSLLIRDILNLGRGSVIGLDRPVGEPLNILVNGELVGRGEVVVVEDQFGVRVTELLRPEEKKR